VKKVLFVVTILTVVLAIAGGLLGALGCSGNGGGGVTVEDILEGKYLNQEVVLHGQFLWETLFLSDRPLYVDFMDSTGVISVKYDGQLPESNRDVTVTAIGKRDSTGSIYLSVKSWRY